MRKQIREGLFAELQTSILSNADFRTSIEKNVSERLFEQTHEKLQEVSRQVALNRLSTLSAKVEAGTGFSDYEKNALIEGLLVLKDSQEIISSNEFKESLHNVVKSFNAAGLDVELDRIHESLGAATLESNWSTALHMLLNYAFRTVGSGTPTEAEVSRFLNYAAAAKRLNRYEEALPYLFAACEQNKTTKSHLPSFEHLWIDFKHLTNDEKKQCATIIFNYGTDTEEQSTARLERVNKAFADFIVKHGGDFEGWRVVAPA